MADKDNKRGRKPAKKYIIMKSNPVLVELIEFLRGGDMIKLPITRTITEALLYRAESKGMNVKKLMEQQ